MKRKLSPGDCPKCGRNSWVLNYVKGFYQSVCTYCGYEDVQTESEWQSETML